MTRFWYDNEPCSPVLEWWLMTESLHSAATKASGGRALSNALTFAVISSKWQADDWGRLAKRIGGYRWNRVFMGDQKLIGADNGEGWYIAAIKHGNKSFCASYEKARGLKPWRLGGERLHTGSLLVIDGADATITSMTNERLIACEYANPYPNRNPSRRHTLSREDFAAAVKAGTIEATP